MFDFRTKMLTEKLFTTAIVSNCIQFVKSVYLFGHFQRNTRLTRFQNKACCKNATPGNQTFRIKITIVLLIFIYIKQCNIMERLR